MYLHLLIGVSLFSSGLAVLVTPTASTSDATITQGPQIELLRKQNADNFMGWISYSRGWTAESCDPGNTMYQSGDYWACCSTGGAGCRIIPFQCSNGILIYSASATTLSGGSTVSAKVTSIACTVAYPDPADKSFSICNTLSLFQNEQDTRPRTNINCGVSSKNWSYYRVAPSGASTPISTSSSTRTPTPTSSSSSSFSSTPTSTSATPTIASSVPVPTETGKKTESKAWIAGAVAGPVIGLAIVAFLLWFCLVKRKKNNSSDSQPPPPAATYIPPTSPTTAYQQQNANFPQPPQYYPPPMQQNPTQPVPGMVPFGVAKHDSWVAPQSPQSPQSPGQQWPQHGGSHMSGQAIHAPSPSASPQPQYAQAQQYADHGVIPKGPQAYAHEAGTFSSELEGSGVQRR